MAASEQTALANLFSSDQLNSFKCTHNGHWILHLQIIILSNGSVKRGGNGRTMKLKLLSSVPTSVEFRLIKSAFSTLELIFVDFCTFVVQSNIYLQTIMSTKWLASSWSIEQRGCQTRFSFFLFITLILSLV